MLGPCWKHALIEKLFNPLLNSFATDSSEIYWTLVMWIDQMCVDPEVEGWNHLSYALNFSINKSEFLTTRLHLQLLVPPEGQFDLSPVPVQ